MRDLDHSGDLLSIPTDFSLAENGWRYARPFSSPSIEIGIVRGFNVALPSHFHDEDQVTFVLAGRRRFSLSGKSIEVTADHGLHIAAGVAHRSLNETSDILCVSLYLPSKRFNASDLITELRVQRRRNGGLDRDRLMSILGRTMRGNGSIEILQCSPTLKLTESVTKAAQINHMSREGFSRRFKRHYGITPQAFKLVKRLNEARRLLRAGVPIAAAAAQTGFSDQSHLGRLFRRFFGVTPRQYRCG